MENQEADSEAWIRRHVLALQSSSETNKALEWNPEAAAASLRVKHLKQAGRNGGLLGPGGVVIHLEEAPLRYHCPP